MNDMSQIAGSPASADTAARHAVLIDMLAALDRGDADQSTEPMTDDVAVRFGNNDQVVGKAAFRSVFHGMLANLQKTRHDVHEVWSTVEDPDVVVVRMTVTYTRPDGSTIALPCCNVFRMRGNKIREYDVYVDVSPVFAPADVV